MAEIYRYCFYIGSNDDAGDKDCVRDEEAGQEVALKDNEMYTTCFFHININKKVPVRGGDIGLRDTS